MSPRVAQPGTFVHLLAVFTAPADNPLLQQLRQRRFHRFVATSTKAASDHLPLLKKSQVVSYVLLWLSLTGPILQKTLKQTNCRQTGVDGFH